MMKKKKKPKQINYQIKKDLVRWNTCNSQNIPNFQIF